MLFLSISQIIPFLSVEWNELDRKLAPARCKLQDDRGLVRLWRPKWGHVVEGINDGPES